MSEVKVLRPEDVARRFNHSRPWFYKHRRRLEQLGFPPKDNSVGGWIASAVDNWLDQRGQANSRYNEEDRMLEILHGQTNS